MNELQPVLGNAVKVPLNRPLVGVVIEENGQEVVRYSAEEDSAEPTDAAGLSDVTKQALAVIGAWSDLDWNAMEEGLRRIRHANPPTPPIDDL
jgi:hypothetical protein